MTQDLVLVYLVIIYAIVAGAIAFWPISKATLRDDSARASDGSSADRRDTF